MKKQGIGWMKRKTIAIATVTLHIKEYTDEKNVVHIDIDQTLTGGMKGTSEHRHLDGTEREVEDHVFGKMKGWSRWIQLDEVADEYLKMGFLPEDRYIESYVTSTDNGWTVRQVWGFAEIDGKRYHVRRVVVTKGSKTIKARLVYDYFE